LAVKNGAARQSSGSCLAANCLDLAVAYIGVLRTKVTNYQKQVTRLSKLNSTAGGKAGKQNAFATTRNHLINQGGGNVSNLTCGTSTSNAGRGGFTVYVAVEKRKGKGKLFVYKMLIFGFCKM
jgi:hypothetical protein